MKQQKLNHFYGRVNIQAHIAANKGKLPDSIELMRVGHFIMNSGEEVDIKHEDLDRFVSSFNSGIVGKGEDNSDLSLPINFSHRDEGEAAGWIMELYHDGDGVLRAKTEWTDLGETALTNKRFKYISPEWYFFYRDKETQREMANVLVGAGLTNIPLFKKLRPLTSSDTGAILYSDAPENPSKTNTKVEVKTMKVAQIVTKKVEDLTKEEIAHLKKHVNKLNDEQKTQFASVLEDKPVKPAKKEEASDTGVDAVEFKAMQKRVAEFEAKEKLQAAEKTLGAFVASDKNPDGVMLPKNLASAVEIFTAMDDKTGEKFLAFLKTLPKLTSQFTEAGDEENASDSAANKLLASAKKLAADKKISFNEALKIAKVENPELVKAYNKETKQEA